MNTSKLVFSLNKTEMIVVEFQDDIDKMHCCSEAPIFFVQGAQKYMLENWTLSFNIPILSSLLNLVLKNELQLHALITKDLGYLYAQYKFYSADRTMLEKIGFVFEQVNGQYSWVGERYLVWAYDMAVWLYNDGNGDIVLELTPVYKGNKFDFDGETDFTQYEQFLRDYKPLFTRTLSREVAQQWLEQANSILRQMTENSERQRSG